jgi:hypothetical protein
MYLDLFAELGEILESSLGPGRAAHVLCPAHPLEPPDGVSDYDSRVRLSAYLTSHAKSPTDSVRRVLSADVERARLYLGEYRAERLRQAKCSFNTALTLVIVGTVVIIGGAIGLYAGSMKTSVLTVATGAISNIVGALLFKLNRDANDRLDKANAGLVKLDCLQRHLERYEKHETKGKQ